MERVSAHFGRVSAETLSHYKKYMSSKGFTKETIRGHLGYMQTFSKKSPNADFTKPITIKFAFMELEGMSNSTKAKYRNVLFSFMDFLIYLGVIEERVFLERVRPEDKKRKALTREEVFKIYSAISDDARLYMIFHTLLNTGLRSSEFCNLRVDDVRDGYVFVRLGKGRKDRSVYVTKEFYRELCSWCEGNDGYIFTTTIDTQMHKESLRKIFAKISKLSGIHVFPHMVRHTFATTAIKSGINIHTLQAMMGHTNITTTSKYLSLAGDQHKEEMEKLTI